VVAVVATTLATACGRPVGRLTPAPPAPLVARTPCGSFRIDPDGRVSVHRNSWAPAWAPGAVSHPAPGVWVAHPHAHLAVYRDGRLLWRSHVLHASDEVVIRGATIAFTIYRHDGTGNPELWLARVGGREFRVAAHEDPVGWTRGGLVTTGGGILRVRGPDGTVYRTLGASHSALAESITNTVLFVSRRGELLRSDGRRTWQIAAGFDRDAWLQRLDGGVLDLSTGRRSVFLRPDGTALGIVAPVDEAAGAMGSVVALPHGRGVVYVVRTGLGANHPGTNVVYVARPHTQPKRLYARRIPRLSCGEYTSLSYDAGRILYVDDEGPIAVLDVSGHRPPLDLTRAFRALQPRGATLAQLNAGWATTYR
jgi:hypothetical protein